MSEAKRKVTYETMAVTPEMAREWLESSQTVNRPDKQWRVRLYADQMKAGQWRENGQAITFHGDNNILNGHNRLMAVVLAGVPVKFLVVRGVDPAAFVDYDAPEATRSRSDTLSIAGVPNAQKVRTLAALVWLAMDDRLYLIDKSDRTFKMDDLLDLVTADAARFQQAVLAGEADHRKFRALPLRLFAFLRYWLPQYDEGLAAEFCDRLADGNGLSVTSPIYLLRTRLINGLATKTRLPPVEVLALLIKSWRYFYHGQSVRQLKWTSRGPMAEAFPNPDPRV